jgi:hypothetical protein
MANAGRDLMNTEGTFPHFPGISTEFQLEPAACRVFLTFAPV